jgi:hypothetical protein
LRACRKLFRTWPGKISDSSKKNPAHPSLHFKKVAKLWSVRVGLSHCALAVQDGVDFVWVWIGPHDEYRRMIG